MSTAKRRTETRDRGSGQRPASRGTRNAERGTRHEEDEDHETAALPPLGDPRHASGARAPGVGSGARRRAEPLPPLAPPAAKQDPAYEQELFELVTAVKERDGLTYPPAWAVHVDHAKRRSLIREQNLKLYLTDHGRLWLNRAEPPPPNARTYEMTKIRADERFLLKEMAKETGVPMQEAIGHIVSIMYEHRDALTRVAVQHGERYPWDAIRWLAPKR